MKKLAVSLTAAIIAMSSAAHATDYMWRTSHTGINITDPAKSSSSTGGSSSSGSSGGSSSGGTTAPVIPSKPLIITGNARLSATIGTAVSYKFGTVNAVGKVGWSIGGGQLPNGLALNMQTGTIIGSPYNPTGTYSFVLSAYDDADKIANVTVTITVK